MATKQQLQNLLAMARRDPMVQSLEVMYRGMEDREEGALSLAVVIQQGAHRFGAVVDMDEMAEVIRDDWGGAE